MSEKLRKKLVNVTIGTAGHIDHGKTLLVKLMTGCDTDTLAEEKKRGLTINLGFAPCSIGGDRQIGIVDVPGHERFIKNMVAGATGIDLVLLVIAADDAVMPQTVEHVHIVELLGIRKAVVALTKIDRVDEEMMELAKEDVREFLSQTVFKDAPICPISSITGKGYPEFYKTLCDAVDTVKPKNSDGVFRLPVERAFSLKGHGTVATGIPASGQVRLGQELELLPSKKKARVRSMQVYSSMSEVARAGECVAMNISGINQDEIERGMALAEPGYFEPTHFVAARVRILGNAPFGLKKATPVRFHVGTSETMANAIVLDKHGVQPGEEALVQFRLSEPVITAPGDHYIIRHNTPLVTAGGGVILGTGRWRLKAGKQFVIEDLEAKEEVLDDSESRVEYLIKSGHRNIVSRNAILKESGLKIEALNEVLVSLARKGTIRKISTQDAFVHILNFEEESEKVLKELSAFHKEDKMALGMEKLEMREKIRSDHDFYEDVVKDLIESGEITAEGKFLSIASHEVALSKDQETALAEIERALLKNQFMPPDVEGLSSSLGKKKPDVEKLLRLLVQQGVALYLGDGIYFHKKAVDAAIEKFVEYLRENESGGAKTFKTLLDTSRKYAYALLDYLDRSGRTVRVKNLRYLKSSERENLPGSPDK